MAVRQNRSQKRKIFIMYNPFPVCDALDLGDET